MERDFYYCHYYEDGHKLAGIGGCNHYQISHDESLYIIKYLRKYLLLGGKLLL